MSSRNFATTKGKKGLLAKLTLPLPPGMEHQQIERMWVLACAANKLTPVSNPLTSLQPGLTEGTPTIAEVAGYVTPQKGPQ